MKRHEAGACEQATHMALTVGVAQRRQEFYAFAKVSFDREGETAARRENTCDGCDDRGELVDIDEDVGGEHEIICRRCSGLLGKKIRNAGGDETVAKTFCVSLR